MRASENRRRKERIVKKFDRRTDEIFHNVGNGVMSRLTRRLLARDYKRAENKRIGVNAAQYLRSWATSHKYIWDNRHRL
jgi:uncharacterized protein with von Willebrand factor type A (vWA) domain